jgi:hypothetical protein
VKKNLKVALFFLFFSLSACAATSKMHISPDDLRSFKGQWEGMRDMLFGIMRFRDFAVMEVFNDTLPLKGKVTIYFLDGTDIRIYPFDKGMVDSGGNLVLPLDEDTKVILSLYRDEEKMKLWGNYFYLGREGTLILHKK